MSSLSYSIPVVGAVDRVEVIRLLSESARDFDDIFADESERQNYCDKIVERAQFFQCKSGNDLVGFAAAYCNDFDSKTAFLTMICVSSKFRRKQIANTLLSLAVEHARRLGFSWFACRIAANNHASLQLHLGLGFEADQTVGEEIHLSRAL